jgi:hypothetical protein
MSLGNRLKCGSQSLSPQALYRRKHYVVTDTGLYHLPPRPRLSSAAVKPIQRAEVVALLQGG